MTPYEQSLLKAAEKNSDLIVMTAENRAFLRNSTEALGDNFIDVGVCEQNMFGVAAGLAMRGKTVLVHALAAFLVLRPYEFIRTLVSFPGRDVKLISAFSGILSEANGFTHQAIEDIALMKALPHMVVMSPACSEEMGAVLDLALSIDGPVYVRYNHLAWQTEDVEMLPHEAASEQAFESSTKASQSMLGELAIGTYQVLSEGSEVMILTHGILTKQAVAAAAQLTSDGVSAGVIYAPVVFPVDQDVVVQAAKSCRLLVLVEDQSPSSGFKVSVLESLANAQVLCPCIQIGVPALGFSPVLLDQILTEEGLDASSIAKRITGTLTELGA